MGKLWAKNVLLWVNFYKWWHPEKYTNTVWGGLVPSNVGRKNLCHICICLTVIIYVTCTVVRPQVVNTLSMVWCKDVC